MNKRLPAIVAILSWLLLGVVAGALVPMTYNLWNDYILATIVGIVFILMGATLGHIVLNITRRRAQKEVEYIAMGIWENNENE